MGVGYQERDADIIDYELWNLPRVQRKLRGPAHASIKDGEYITCIGAAQTFGCYVEEPFPQLLQQELGVPVLNFGVAGAGPAFFKRKNFLAYINGGKIAVLQVMSGRSTANSLFDQANSGELLIRKSDGMRQGAAPMYADLLNRESRQRVAEIVEETRENWVREFQELIDSISVPIILVWFSVRSPDYKESTKSVERLFGAFPQLVNREMIERLKPRVERYVEHVSDSGLPQKLISRTTGRPTSIKMRADLSGRKKLVNDYYPSPQMHQELSAKLIPAAREVLEGLPAPGGGEQDPLLVSLHLPKTGGTSLLHVLKEKYGNGFQSAYGKHASPGSNVFHKGSTVRCVHGHNIARHFSGLLETRNQCQWITFLRDPLATAISFYFFARKNLNKDPEAPLFDDRGLENWLLNTRPAAWPHPPGYPFNQYTKALKANGLQFEDFTFIGITERFDESMLCLYSALDWKPIKYRAENRGRYNPPELDGHIVARFKEINAEDYALYEKAQNRLDSCIREYGHSFDTDLAELTY